MMLWMLQELADWNACLDNIEELLELIYSLS